MRDIDVVNKIRNGTWKEGNEEVADGSDDVIEEDQDEVEDSWGLNLEIVYELVDPGVFIGVRSEPSSIEPFYIAEVVEKSTTKDFIEDERGHIIARGDHYAVVYLEKKGEQGRGIKRKVVYQRAKDNRVAFVNIGEIFVTNVQLSENLVMDMEEYFNLQAVV